jgi:hypothetical protein
MIGALVFFGNYPYFFKRITISKERLLAGDFLSTFKTGFIHETKVFLKLLQMGYNVVFPAIPTQWDIGIEKNGRIIKIQCKTGFRAKKDPHRLRFRPIRGRYGKTKKYRKSEVDFFAVYCREKDQIFMFSLEEVLGVTEACLSFSVRREKSCTRGSPEQRRLENFKF